MGGGRGPIFLSLFLVSRGMGLRRGRGRTLPSLSDDFLSKACWSLTRHLVFAWSSLSIVMPIMKMMIELGGF
jgi:hypothetical protein